MSSSGTAAGQSRACPETTCQAGGPPVLSWLLLVTAVALPLSVALRVPRLMESIAPSAAVIEHGPSPVAPLSPTDIEPAAGPPEAAPTPADAPTATATSSPPSRLEVLEELAAELRRHQATLIERERTIGVREAVVSTVQARVHAQLDKLGEAKQEIERLLGQVSTDEQARIGQLIKVYEAMKAKSAALIFDPMALELLLPIVRGMRDTKVAAIIAEMDPAKARALTTALAQPPDLTKNP